MRNGFIALPTLFITALFVFSPLSPTHLFAAVIQPGDLLISEIMADPDKVNDSMGEWFEIFNASGQTFDLNGLRLHDDGSDSHNISHGSPLIIAPGQYFIFGRNGDSGTNGGYTADYVYSGFLLANTVDEIVLSQASTEIVRLNYTSTAAGISTELTSTSPFPPTFSDYSKTPNTLQYGLGDIGTPGASGSTALVATPAPSAGILMGTTLLGFIVWQWRTARRDHSGNPSTRAIASTVSH